MRLYYLWTYISLVNRAVYSWSCDSPPSILPTPQNVVPSLLFFSTPRTFDKKFRCFGWQSKLLLCLQLAQIQNERLRALDFLSLTASRGVSFPPAVSCGWLCSLLFIGDASLCHFLNLEKHSNLFWNKNFVIPELLENQ